MRKSPNPEVTAKANANFKHNIALRKNVENSLREIASSKIGLPQLNQALDLLAADFLIQLFRGMTSGSPTSKHRYLQLYSDLKFKHLQDLFKTLGEQAIIRGLSREQLVKLSKLDEDGFNAELERVAIEARGGDSNSGGVKTQAGVPFQPVGEENTGQ